jgi:hypothetical protein
MHLRDYSKYPNGEGPLEQSQYSTAMVSKLQLSCRLWDTNYDHHDAIAQRLDTNWECMGIQNADLSVKLDGGFVSDCQTE